MRAGERVSSLSFVSTLTTSIPFPRHSFIYSLTIFSHHLSSQLLCDFSFHFSSNFSVCFQFSILISIWLFCPFVPWPRVASPLSVERLRKFGNASPRPPTTGPILLARNAQSSSVKKLNGSKFKRKLVAISESKSNSHVNSTTTTTPGNGGPDSAVETRKDEYNSSTTSCPPCETGDGEGGGQTIGFVTEWINAYIFLARKFRGCFGCWCCWGWRCSALSSCPNYM